MFKPITRMAAAVLAAGAIAFAISAAPAANGQEATQETKQETRQPSAPAYAKADRLSVVVRGSACSRQGWPNFESKCRFDLREPGGKARTVRMIALR